ncbi:DUF1653 domain-containing protein [Legionella hackeliae]|uniref:DUF1653 domain-containing protein n=1 Tax=Legionella hackeliae TaxID=449 RepID=A0A0A8UXJ0_LEGHA|nr:DUF1653 domain-containing protein [Legionella hackeliae]KTD12435.1 hypothetical protein Lhac_1306 [Legionella hackeliae]CEK11847.1 conserved protein of unknown function [Legionella hackeliae]STX48613.1 Uncharacterized protein conserved in bacteria [Legionella hackeliae]
MLSDPIICGKYIHYKNEKLYEVIGQARHSETDEEMIVYRALYRCDQFGDNQLWVRPMKMFFENVIHHGKTVPRFKRIE